MGRHSLVRWGRLASGLGLATLVFSSPVAFANSQPESRLRLIPIVSDQRLEDIQESADGTRLLTHDQGFAPKLWDPKSMRQLAVLGGHPRFLIERALMSLDGTRIITRSGDMVRLWDSVRARPLAEWSFPEDDDPRFTSVAISNDNKWMAFGTTKGQIFVAEAVKGSALKLVTTIPNFPSNVVGPNVLSIDFSDDSKQIVASGMSPDVIVADVAEAKLKLRFMGSPIGAPWVEFSPDAKQILLTRFDSTASLHDAGTGQKQYSWEHYIGDKGFMPNTLMAALFVNSDRSEVLVAGKDGTMSIYDRVSGITKRQLKGYTQPIREIRKTRDGLSVATYEDQMHSETYEPLKIWNVITTKEYGFKRGHDSPTAGEFSADGRFFWVGYGDGSLRRHELATGKIFTETLSAANPFLGVRQIDSTGRMAIRRNGGSFAEKDTYTIFDGQNLAPDSTYSADGYLLEMSPSGRLFKGLGFSQEDGKNVQRLVIWNVQTGQSAWGLWDACEGASWGGEEHLVAWDKQSVALFDMRERKFLGMILELKDPIKVSECLLTPDNKWVLVAQENGPTLAISVDDPKRQVKLPSYTGFNALHWAISPDGTKVAVPGAKGGVVLAEIATGNIVHTFAPIPNVTSDSIPSSLFFSPGGKYIIYESEESLVLMDAATGKDSRIIPLSYGDGSGGIISRFSPDGKWFVSAGGKQAWMVNLETGKIDAWVSASDTIVGVSFSLDGRRMFLVDATDQGTIWDCTLLADDTSGRKYNGKVPESLVSHKTPLKLGSFVFMRDGSWLVMDTDGRYDGSDPSNVTGASYVLEWEGGLEPIDVSQLKSLYYEPGLLQKLLGLSKEPRRSVPDLSAIRLYPEVSVERSKTRPASFTISLTERDQGGIGTVRVYINGKEIQRKDGVGFFNVDTSQFLQYFLPAAQLPEGQGNLLQVVATNKRGDLSSRATTVDLGIPDGLKTPEVNLYGLFVGTGDYVGNRRDLSAPPSDAIKLAEAVQKAGFRLLPNRVHVTSLTTATDDPTARPTRSRILAWFEEISKKATSSDIIIVFFAGHGTSRIGEQRGYFYLTADADPGDVTPAILGTATISSDDIQSYLSKIPAGKQVIILDTCHSGAAADSLLAKDRSISSDYARAYESIKDASGTWLLAGSAADQLSYESSNVDHGMLTYSLLEAIDRASADGLRSTSSGELFVDVERWLTYAATRVDSLKNEVGVSGIQRPEFKRSRAGTSFDIGVTRPSNRGELGLKPPMPIVIMGNIEQDEEDPLGLEPIATATLRDSRSFKLWTDIGKHPNVYRISGTYTVEGDVVKVRLAVQKFDSAQNRKTLETLVIEGSKSNLKELAMKLRTQVEVAILAQETARTKQGN